jgi:hypothetical protein
MLPPALSFLLEKEVFQLFTAIQTNEGGNSDAGAWRQMNDVNSLEFLRAVYCNDKLPLSVRMRAAGMALPFEHPKLAVTAVVTDQSFSERLERAVLRSQASRSEMKVIEHQPINDEASDGLNGDGLKRKTDLTLAPMVPDRRFRRRA